MPHDNSSTTSTVQEYWISGYGLSKQIMLRQLNFFLGPEATVRPYSYCGRDGYMIFGVQLTQQQIADLKKLSKEYERQQTIRMSGRTTDGEDLPEDADINTVVVISPRRRSPTYTSSNRRQR